MSGWLSAIGLAIAVHAGWWFLLDAAPVEGRTTLPPHRRIAFVPPLQDPNSKSYRDWLRTWSPTLFSLPSPQGFSQKILEDKIEVVPPIEVSTKSVLFFERAGKKFELPTVNYERELIEMVMQTRASMPLNPPADGRETPRSAERASPLTIHWSGSGILDDLEGLSLPAESPGATPSYWEARMVLTWDRFGRINHVMLERSSDSESRDAELVRLASTWKHKNPGSGGVGRLIIRMVSGQPALPGGSDD